MLSINRLQLVGFLMCFQLAGQNSLEKVETLVIGNLIFEVLDLVQLLKNRRDEETVGKEGHKHEPDEVNRLVHATDVTQESRYRINLTRVDVVQAVISQVDGRYISVLKIDLVIIETTVLDLNEINFFLLTELNIVILQLNK